MLLAGYCPEYWERVEAYVADEGAGSFLRKPVIATDTVTTQLQALIVLGVNPASQAALAQQLATRGNFLIWNDLITR
jgi:hypothetical protein